MEHHLTINATGSPGLSNLFINSAIVYGLQDDYPASGVISTSTPASQTSAATSSSVASTSTLRGVASSSKSVNIAAVAGGVVSGVAGLLLVTVIIWVLVRRRRRQSTRRSYGSESEEKGGILPSPHSTGAVADIGGATGSFPESPTSSREHSLQSPMHVIGGSDTSGHDAQTVASTLPRFTTLPDANGQSGTLCHSFQSHRNARTCILY